MRYRVLREYRKDRLTLTPGQLVEMPAALAEWIEGDCPGTLERTLDAPAHDRMVRRGNRR